MNKSIFFSTLIFSSAVFADQTLPPPSQNTSVQHQQPAIVALTSARPECDNGWYLFADALYWHADVGNADWANLAIVNGDARLTKVHHLDFKWSWGFKVGLGFDIDHDLWDTNLYYTWFHTENSNAIGLSSTAPASAIQTISTQLPATNVFTSAKHHWSIHFSMFDWELGRWYYLSKNLTVRPHIGIKGGWIDQDRKVHGQVFANNQSGPGSGHFENDFWGVGPSAGINTMWILGSAGKSMDHRFSLFGDIAGALMYGHFENKFSRNFTGFTSKIKKLNRNLAVSMLQAMMGLSWDTPFNKERNHFTLKLGYEYQYWFRQNQFPSIGEIINQTLDINFLQLGRYSDDLALQGLTAELRFDF